MKLTLKHALASKGVGSGCYDYLGRDAMPLWQRLLITLVTMLLTSFAAGLLWRGVFNGDIPSYLSGVVGGVTAVPMWEFLKRVGPNPQSKPIT